MCVSEFLFLLPPLLRCASCHILFLVQNSALWERRGKKKSPLKQPDYPHLRLLIRQDWTEWYLQLRPESDRHVILFYLLIWFQPEKMTRWKSMVWFFSSSSSSSETDKCHLTGRTGAGWFFLFGWFGRIHHGSRRRRSEIDSDLSQAFLTFDTHPMDCYSSEYPTVAERP